MSLKGRQMKVKSVFCRSTSVPVFFFYYFFIFDGQTLFWSSLPFPVSYLFPCFLWRWGRERSPSGMESSASLWIALYRSFWSLGTKSHGDVRLHKEMFVNLSLYIECWWDCYIHQFSPQNQVDHTVLISKFWLFNAFRYSRWQLTFKSQQLKYFHGAFLCNLLVWFLQELQIDVKVLTDRNESKEGKKSKKVTQKFHFSFLSSRIRNSIEPILEEWSF